MTGIISLFRTTIGKKVIMALTGLIWIFYLLMHMYGNLKIFSGAEVFNTYASGLRTLGAPVFGYSHVLWIARILLILSIAGHVWASLSLTALNKFQSRETGYNEHIKLRSNAAQATMIYGGIALALFIIYHLLHLTFGTPGIHNTFDAQNVYHNVISGLKGFPAFIYLAALLSVGFHIYHGFWSVFQTLGLNNEQITGKLKAISVLVALIITLGFAVVPIAVITGYIN
jgi:succinate dehydrogenase / fumarate reductase cytochrome b subunit